VGFDHIHGNHDLVIGDTDQLDPQPPSVVVVGQQVLYTFPVESAHGPAQ
jgi:hypothetical protein